MVADSEHRADIDSQPSPSVPEKKELAFVFQGLESAPTFPVTDIWGGVGPAGGLVVAHLLFSHAAIPNVISVSPDASGKMDINSGKRVVHGDIINKVQATISLTPEHATAIGAWLIQNAENALKQRGSAKGN